MGNKCGGLISPSKMKSARRCSLRILHFGSEWKGPLPSTANAISRYLASHVATLAINMLRQRLPTLSRWHTDQGFLDLTKSSLVRQVLKGIRSVHAVSEKRARPLELTALQQVDQWLDAAISNTQKSEGRLVLLRHTCAATTYELGSGRDRWPTLRGQIGSRPSS